MKENRGACKYCGHSIRWIKTGAKKQPVEPYIQTFTPGGGNRKYITPYGEIFTNCSPTPPEAAQYTGFEPHKCLNVKTKTQDPKNEFSASFEAGYRHIRFMKVILTNSEMQQAAAKLRKSANLYTNTVDKSTALFAHHCGVLQALDDLKL